MKRRLANIFRLGVKELWSLWRDPLMLLLIVYTFTSLVHTTATSMPETLQNAPIAIVDEDGSPLSQRIVSAFYPPNFSPPQMITLEEMDKGMDKGRFTFVLDIPPNFQSDVLAGRSPQIQLNVDATRMTQAFSGNGYVQQIVMNEIDTFVQRHATRDTLPVDLALRTRFNPSLEKSWFGGLMEMMDSVILLSIVLTGAALIREQEHGTIEHLLVMPVTPSEIMLAKIWSMGAVVLVAVTFCLTFVVHGVLHMPVQGSVPLFLMGAAVYLFATTAVGIFMATVARSMPQFGMLLVLVLVPLQMLSGSMTPRESMPEFVQTIMLAAPTTHFVEVGAAILFRGAGFDVVWKPFLALLVIGTVLFILAFQRFRQFLR